MTFSCCRCSGIKSPKWPELSSVKHSFHDGSNIRRASRGWADHHTHHPPAAGRCAARFYTFEDVTELSDDPGLQSGEHLNTQLNVKVGLVLASHIINSGEISRFCTVEKTDFCMQIQYRKNALQESQQELRDQVRVQQTPPWSQWHLTLVVGGDGAATLARQTDQSHFKWDAEDTWEQSIFKLD